MPDDPAPPDIAFEDFPLTRQEYINSMIHFYRGEIGRADAWRARLDPTTNWAVVTAGGMLSIAFAGPSHSHVTLLLANVLICVFLGFEARRFRYFDVWRSRVRMLEENFFIPILRRNLVSPRGAAWREFVAEDLDHPTFKISFLDAIGVRLRYNYVWIFLAVLLAWAAKIHLHPFPVDSPGELLARMEVGPLPGPGVLAGVAAFYAVAIGLAIRGDRRHGASDEVKGVELEVARWKR